MSGGDTRTRPPRRDGHPGRVPISTEPVVLRRTSLRERLAGVRVPQLRGPRLAALRVHIPRPRLRSPEEALVRSTAGTDEGARAEHPRLRIRRTQVADQHRRRRNRRLAAVIALVVLVALVIGALFSPWLSAREVVVTGVEAADHDEVVAATGIGSGATMVGLDPAAVRGSVEDLAWVSHASVHREWPDTVVVDVRPQTPVARVALGEDAPALVATATGSLLPLTGAGAQLAGAGDTPILRIVGGGPVPATGEPGTATGSLRDALWLVERLGEGPRQALVEATWEDGSLSLQLRDDGVVELGAPDNLPAKLLGLDAALSGDVELACLSTLDLTAPPRFTISRRPGCEVPPPTEFVTPPTTTPLEDDDEAPPTTEGTADAPTNGGEDR